MAETKNSSNTAMQHATSRLRPLHDKPNKQDTARWHHLLKQLDPTALADTFLKRLREIPGYNPSPFTSTELEQTAVDSFTALVNGLRAGSWQDEKGIAESVGVSRARAGVPLSSLMTAIRHDFSVLWEAITHAATPQDAELIVRHTADVLRVVDEYVGHTQRAYTAERQHMREEKASVRRGLISALFAEQYPETSLVQTVAAELGIETTAPLTLIVANSDSIPEVRKIASELERAGTQIFTYHAGDEYVVFGRIFVMPGSRGYEIAKQFYDLRVAIMQVPGGLAELPRLSLTARELARSFRADETGAMTWARGWTRLAAQRLRANGQNILPDVDAALASQTPAARARLIEAVASYLQTGSVAETATQLFCHRNTISNRLHKFAEITGVNPLIPQDAARLVVGWA